MNFNHPNIQSTKNRNMYYTHYIATREGVALNEDIKIFNENETSNEDYVKYINSRPRSHGLFSKYENTNLHKVMEEMKDYEGYVYKNIISLREEDAVKYGYDNMDKWKELLRDKMFYLSQQYDIPYSQMRWVAAFHREKGHPHVHLMIWNSQVEVKKNGVISKDKIENIRKHLTNEIFREERESILMEKNCLRDLLLEGVKGEHNNNSKSFEELMVKYKDIDKDLYSELEEINLNDIEDRIRDKFREDLLMKIENLKVPQEGRLQYKLMPPDIKNEIDKISDFIFKDAPNMGESNFRIYMNKYLKSVEDLTRLYTDKEEDIQKSINNAKDDIYSRIGNSILKTKKSLIFHDNKFKNNIDYKENFLKARKDYEIQSLVSGMLKVITSKTNHNNNKTKSFADRTKSQKKEFIKKNKAKGLYSENELDI